MKDRILKLLIPFLLLAVTACVGDSNDSSQSETDISENENLPNTEQPETSPSEPERIIWSDYPGIPDDAELLPDGTACEEFSHVDHLPWDERPSACPSGDWCMKKDDGFIQGASTWFGLRAVNQYATITCKIGNQCLRFVGMNNCHYDLYDPDSMKTLEPSDQIPCARKDGHSYLNFRVRMPGSDTIYNFMSTTAEAQLDAKEAVYCPSNVYAPDGIEPLFFDPRQGDQTTGCGTEAPYIWQYGDLRDAIPYHEGPRDDYDWTYEQNGERAPHR